MTGIHGGCAEAYAGVPGDIRAIHEVLSLCGEPRNALLSSPPECLGYLRSLLAGEPAAPPEMREEQWAAFIGALKPHYVLPYMYWHLRSAPASGRPPERFVSEMRMSFLSSGARMVWMEAILKKILCAFAEDGISALVIKGPALAHSAYPDPAMRPYSDIDLLVKPGEVQKARQSLERVGYMCKARYFERSKHLHWEEVFLPHRPDIERTVIELHWSLVQHYIVRRYSLEEVFDRAVTVKSRGFPLKTLCPVDALLNNALHLSYNHNDSIRLSWILDTSRLFKLLASPGDWADLRKSCGRWGARLALEKSLRMARYWTGLAVPVDLSSWPGPAEWERRAFSYATEGRDSAIADFRLRWPGNEGTAEKLKALLYLAFPDPELIKEKYPPPREWMLPLSYLARFVSLAGRLRK